MRENSKTLQELGVLFPAQYPAEMYHATLEIRGIEEQWGHRAGEFDGTWARLCRRARAFDGTSVISHRLLSSATPEQVRTALAELEGTEVHIVVTARDLARQIPPRGSRASSTAARSPSPSSSSGPSTRRGPPPGQQFWDRQDVPDVLARWGAGLPPERVHVVTNPPSGSAPHVLWDRFLSVFGVDPSGSPSRQRVQRLPRHHRDRPAPPGERGGPRADQPGSTAGSSTATWSTPCATTARRGQHAGGALPAPAGHGQAVGHRDRGPRVRRRGRPVRARLRRPLAQRRRPRRGLPGGDPGPGGLHHRHPAQGGRRAERRRPTARLGGNVERRAWPAAWPAGSSAPCAGRADRAGRADDRAPRAARAPSRSPASPSPRWTSTTTWRPTTPSRSGPRTRRPTSRPSARRWPRWCARWRTSSAPPRCSGPTATCGSPRTRRRTRRTRVRSCPAARPPAGTSRWPRPASGSGSASTRRRGRGWPGSATRSPTSGAGVTSNG